MANILYIHPDNPQPRLIKQAVAVLDDQGVVVLPTDSGYALATKIDNKKGQDRMAAIRHLEKGHFFSLLCADLSDIAHFARVSNEQYRLLKAATPGAFTFILKANQKLPKRVFGDKRKTIGIRVPAHQIIHDLLIELKEPLLTTTLILPNEEISQMYIEDIYDVINPHVDLVIDGGGTSFEPTTILDLSTQMPPVLIRQGQADASPFI
ncbi:MAG: threonylcarbamoyl-AMP synthase [Gammaproteobacteria bacterium]|nr:MAG: threonylcarbamoyl-AMP synthase [Gammaproteobacteria bacterium]